MSRKYYDLVLKWAPVNYQYIDLNEKCNYHNIKRDLLCQVNFPSNTTQYSVWDTEHVRDRLEHADIAHLTPTAYYSIAETDNHFFILYSFYHADDSTHPNDMEGCLIILEKKEGKELLLGMITIAHYDFWYYTYKNRLSVKEGITTSGEFEIDEEFDGHGHPLIQQEEGKHGLYALGTHIAWHTKLSRWFLSLINKFPDIIVYYPPVTTASKYSLENLTKGKKMPYDPAFYYELVDILDNEKGLWKRWLNKPNETFNKDGKFYGGSANPPWQWKSGLDIKKDKEQKIELMWTDPQQLASENFKPRDGGKEFNSTYTLHMDGTK